MTAVGQPRRRRGDQQQQKQQQQQLQSPATAVRTTRSEDKTMKRWGQRPAHDRRGMGRRASDYEHGARIADLGAGPLAALGFLGGVTLGVVLWSRQLSRSKQDLFSSRPLRRLAALGYISGQPSIDNARLLRDYMRWEKRPILRRRAQQVLRQVEEYLE